MREGITTSLALDSEFSVPTHSELNLDPLQFRFPDYLKIYKN